MNYYEHHIGDYDAATAHLSWDEDAAYRRLLSVYYRTEKPLPAELERVCRLIRATTPAQRKAVKSVLEEFFLLAEDGWHQDRGDAEIAVYRTTEPAREAKRANEALRQQRHREERADLFRRLNAAGQHAGWNIHIDKLRAMVEALPAAPVTESTTAPVTPVTRDESVTGALPATAPVTPATATHTPVPIPQTPDTTSQTPPPIPKDEKGKAPPLPGALFPEVDPNVLRDFGAVRRAKKAPLTETAAKGIRREAEKAGIPVEQALRICCEKGWQAFDASWNWQSAEAARPPASSRKAVV